MIYDRETPVSIRYHLGLPIFQDVYEHILRQLNGLPERFGSIDTMAFDGPMCGFHKIVIATTKRRHRGRSEECYAVALLMQIMVLK